MDDQLLSSMYRLLNSESLLSIAANVLMGLTFLMSVRGRVVSFVKKIHDLTTQQQIQSSDEPETHSPTANAELILHLLLKPDEAEVLGGDLQERYGRKNKQLGKRRARIWLWGQVLRSIWPLLKRFFTTGGFLAAAEFVRRLLS